MQRLTPKTLAKMLLYDMTAIGRIAYEGKNLWVYDLGGDGVVAVDEDLETILFGKDLLDDYDFISADILEDEDAGDGG